MLQLPSKSSAIPEVLDTMLASGIAMRNVFRVMWYIIYAYLHGARRFDRLDYKTGSVEFEYEDEDVYEEGGLPFRWNLAQSRIETEIGRYTRLDTAPRTKNRKHSLKSLRDAALGQALLDGMLEGVDRRTFDEGIIPFLIQYGTVGLGHWETQAADPLRGFSWEIIPPWELIAVPGDPATPSMGQAIARERFVPLSQLRRSPKLGVPMKEEDLDVMEVPVGTGGGMGLIDTPAGFGHVSYDELFGTGRKPQKSTPDDRIEKVVRLIEVWEQGPRNSLSREIVKAGKVLLYDSREDFRDLSEPVPFPVGIARGLDLGGFYGWPFAWKVIPFASRMERLLRALITNCEDLDRFGILMVPDGIGVTDSDFENTGRPRVIFYNRDMTEGMDPVFPVQPVSSSDIPGRLIKLMSEQLDDITSQGPLYSGQATGRVDSGEGMGTLAELGSTHLRATARSIEHCFETVYRSMLYQAKKGLSRGSLSGRRLDLITVNNSMLGLTIDPKTGSVDLTGMMGPDIWSLEIGIKSADPMEGERRRQEGLLMLQQGIMDPLQFIIANYREGWGYPVGNEGIWENYVKAVMGNLVMFGDGKVPGETWVSTIIDKPAVYAYALEEFITGAAFSLASPEVQAAFTEKYQSVKEQMGQRLPQGAVPADQAALAQQLSTAAQMRGPGG